MVEQSKNIVINGRWPKKLKQKYSATAKSFRILFLLRNKVEFYHFRKLGTYSDFEFLLGFLSDLKQPSEARVRSAMIYSTWDHPSAQEAMYRYDLKHGGESNSDSHFESSLSCMITSPITGEDTWAVIIKKYSTIFKDVLITYNEIKNLYLRNAPVGVLKERDHEYACFFLGEFLKGYTYGVNPFNPKQNIEPHQFEDLFEQHKSKIPAEDFLYAYEKFYKRATDELSYKLEETEPAQNQTEEFRKKAANRLLALDHLKSTYFKGPKGSGNQPSLGVKQLSFF